MVSVIAKKLANKRQHQALCEVFDKADITRDGTISIAEYMALCEEYGVELSDKDIEAVKEIADEDGEVHKSDFICHIKNMNMLKDFEVVDRESDFHWRKKADLAFRIFDANSNGYVSKKEFKWMTTNKKIRNKDVDTLFKIYDLNKDGKLDYSEFTSFMFRQKERLEKKRDETTLGENNEKPRSR